MHDHNGAQCLGPDALALLQTCFDTLIERNHLSRKSDGANLIAAALFRAYGHRITDKSELMRLADIAQDMRKAEKKPVRHFRRAGLG